MEHVSAKTCDCTNIFKSCILRTLKGYLLDVNLPLVVCYKTFFVLPTSYGDKWQNMKSLISQFSLTNFDA